MRTNFQAFASIPSHIALIASSSGTALLIAGSNCARIFAVFPCCIHPTIVLLRSENASGRSSPLDADALVEALALALVPVDGAASFLHPHTTQSHAAAA